MSNNNIENFQMMADATVQEIAVPHVLEADTNTKSIKRSIFLFFEFKMV